MDDAVCSVQAFIPYRYRTCTTMASILLKNIPEDLHRRLREQAVRHHRSLNKEVIAVLEEALTVPASQALPPPVRLKRRLTQPVLDRARRAGRA